MVRVSCSFLAVNQTKRWWTGLGAGILCGSDNQLMWSDLSPVGNVSWTESGEETCFSVSQAKGLEEVSCKSRLGTICKLKRLRKGEETHPHNVISMALDILLQLQQHDVIDWLIRLNSRRQSYQTT